jgi:multiple sugar transport system permease protein
MYIQAFNFTDFGYASTLAVILAVIVFVLALLQLRIMRTDDAEEPA